MLNNLAQGKWRYEKSTPDLLRSTVVCQISSVLSFKDLNIVFRDIRTSADEKKVQWLLYSSILTPAALYFVVSELNIATNSLVSYTVQHLIKTWLWLVLSLKRISQQNLTQICRTGDFRSPLSCLSISQWTSLLQACGDPFSVSIRSAVLWNHLTNQLILWVSGNWFIKKWCKLHFSTSAFYDSSLD